ncbi:3-dehydroquinate synthase [Legionella maceachernii]|uniref:3-dehydroquinate synthase n=1 Tax=Legionella maceachernii TaxID=466 RepID=A0A0W0W0G5_9GAMM|nr:3-dehydroquinate synthase [Legionella maceachernii]KTD26007.1 3-dehydroquinate synthase [Legionella maceachernii]SJZ50473.1 3-dehydroquinate synthase [Legionella maceachernii]SUP03747.1 3-dehydroquinate synthase [Legionella maceachernii]
MAKFKLHQELIIRLPGHEYPILIGHNALTDENLFHRYVLSKQVLIVTNTTVAPIYLGFLKAVFADRQCDTVILEDGEAFKNQQSLFTIYDALIAKHHHRDTTLIALGGGVVGDITGFAAATYQRGVRFLQIPTTLLAQVDASIGGKTAINHPQAKNMIGSFHQPSAVIIDLNTLKTLPLREFRAGLAEVIKHALLAGGEFLNLVYAALEEGLDSNHSAQLPEVISQSCRIKADIVQADEREAGQRALLNLGHTFAHALEAYTHYERWLHGEAVAIGLYCAALLSYQLGLLEEKALQFVDKLLMMAKLPRRIPADIDLNELRALMSQDKKIKNKHLRFILMSSMGNCHIQDNVPEDSLRLSLQSAVEGD